MTAAPIAGADGCRAGWLLVRADGSGRPVTHGLCRNARTLLDRAGGAVLALDIPIGLAECDGRDADRLARRALGARGSSVFPAPPRSALAARTYDEAKALARAATGKALTLQAWHILPKIRDVDRALRTDALASARVHEVHPELCFLQLNGGRPMAHAKRTAEGRAERAALLVGPFPRAFEAIRAAYRASDVASDDILDALAALWTAARLRDGTARHFPDGEPPRDALGLPMRISA